MMDEERDEKNLSFDECWPATLVCSQPSQPHYNRLIKSQRVRVPLASIRLSQGFHKNRFLTDSFQSNRGYSRIYKSHRRATRVQTPAISKRTTFRLTTRNCSPGNPYPPWFPFLFYILLLDFLRSPPFLPCLIFFPVSRNSSKFSFSNWMERIQCILTERALQIKKFPSVAMRKLMKNQKVTSKTVFLFDFKIVKQKVFLP